MYPFGIILPIALGLSMCLHPLVMYPTGRKTPNGKIEYTFKSPPLPRDGIPVPCGKCLSCLETRRNEWIKRLMLEQSRSPFNSFITLTYDDKHLPSDSLASKSHIQNFIKRFRNVARDYGIPLPRFKYFIVSEYGKKFGRPHYHGLFFGVDLLSREWQPFLASLGKYPCFSSRILEKVWSNGFVCADRLTVKSVRYVTKYITKSVGTGVWSLKSMSLAKSIFASKDGFNSFGLDTFRNGFIYLRSPSGGFYRSSAPRFLDSIAERFEPILYDDVKSRRREYCTNLPLYDLAMRKEVLKTNHGLELTNRKLDNET